MIMGRSLMGAVFFIGARLRFGPGLEIARLKA
jgi:hypothetical protein